MMPRRTPAIRACLSLILATTAAWAAEPVVVRLREAATVDHAEVVLDDVAEVDGPATQVAAIGRVVVRRIVGLGEHAIGPGVVRAALGDLGEGGVDISGTCRVSRAVRTFPVEDLVAAAAAHLRGRIGEAEVSVVPKRRPGRMTCLVDAAAPAELVAEPLAVGWWGEVPYRVRLLRGDRELDRDLVVFDVTAYRRVPVAARRLPKGTELSLPDLVVERVEVRGAELADAPGLEEVLGRRTRRELAPGTPITDRAARPPPDVEAGSAVVLVVENPAFRLKAHGTAITAGRIGDRVAVRNQHGKKLHGRVVGGNEVAIVSE